MIPSRNLIAASSALAFMLVVSATAGPPLVEGRFGRGLAVPADGNGWAEAAYRVEYGSLPITFECWVRVDETARDGVIASLGSTDQSGRHWAILCHAGAGEIGLQAAGLLREAFRSRVAVGDGQWHHVALQLEERHGRLLVDGAEAINTTAEPGSKWKLAGPLCFGGYYHLYSASRPQGTSVRQPVSGVIDEARLSRGLREIREIPQAPLPLDTQTLGLWRFDSMVSNHFTTDLSSLDNPVFIPDIAGKSMDQLDLEEFGSPPSPLDGPATPVHLVCPAVSDQLPTKAVIDAPALLCNSIAR